MILASGSLYGAIGFLVLCVVIALIAVSCIKIVPQATAMVVEIGRASCRERV